jgi:hypothetical protein
MLLIPEQGHTSTLAQHLTLFGRHMRKFTGSSLVPRLGNGDRAKIPYSGSCGDEEQRKSRSLLQTRYHKAIHSIKFQDNIRKFRQMQDTRFLSTLEGFSAYSTRTKVCSDGTCTTLVKTRHTSTRPLHLNTTQQ